MPRKLKVYRTSIGFFELVVAAPSMKAAAESWGSDADIFRRGFAEETDDAKAVEAALAKPGTVLRRAVGSQEAFKAKASLPKAAAAAGPSKQPEKRVGSAKAGKNDRAASAERKAEQKRAAAEKRRAEAEAERQRRHREARKAKADAALERAKDRHEKAMQSLEKKRDEVDRQIDEERERWESDRRKHEEALRSLDD